MASATYDDDRESTLVEIVMDFAYDKRVAQFWKQFAVAPPVFGNIHSISFNFNS